MMITVRHVTYGTGLRKFEFCCTECSIVAQFESVWLKKYEK